ncbi:hypothetical protein [Roseitalea sp. MMSF_3504]|nr:hypothetical protein [Roseitalea sp. MMSF_3504]
MVKRGTGVGLMMSDIAGMTPRVVPVPPTFGPVAVPVWLVGHREPRASRRIRVVLGLRAEALAAASGAA